MNLINIALYCYLVGAIETTSFIFCMHLASSCEVICTLASETFCLGETRFSTHSRCSRCKRLPRITRSHWVNMPLDSNGFTIQIAQPGAIMRALLWLSLALAIIGLVSVGYFSPNRANSGRKIHNSKPYKLQLLLVTTPCPGFPQAIGLFCTEANSRNPKTWTDHRVLVGAKRVFLGDPGTYIS